MITYKRSCAKTLLFIALSLFLQGCSTFRTCATFLDDEAYKGSLNYKAIAMYFDRETQRPPAQISQVENECWFDFEASSQEEANSIVLSGCGLIGGFVLYLLRFRTLIFSILRSNSIVSARVTSFACPKEVTKKMAAPSCGLRLPENKSI